MLVYVILDMHGEGPGIPGVPEVFITRGEAEERWAEIVDGHWEQFDIGPPFDANGVFGIPREEMYENDVLLVMGEGIEWRRWTVNTPNLEM